MIKPYMPPHIEHHLRSCQKCKKNLATKRTLCAEACRMLRTFLTGKSREPDAETNKEEKSFAA
jgi:hypothetical protein